MELINLQSAYNKINDQLFNGSLPGCVLSWNNRRTSCFGICYTYRNEIQISTLQKKGGRDSFSYLNTLAHEICHLWLNNHGLKNVGHGKEFFAIAKYLNDYGFKISTHSTFDADKNTKCECLKTGSYFFDGLHLYRDGKVLV